jgi:hypothetical protein
MWLVYENGTKTHGVCLPDGRFVLFSDTYGGEKDVGYAIATFSSEAVLLRKHAGARLEWLPDHVNETINAVSSEDA